MELKDGRKFETIVVSPRGSENNFASEEDIIDKFQKLASRAIAAKQVERIRDGMLSLENIDNATELISLLSQK